tara:strand:+ start:5013 stop:6047 length:1035 start_codon:yes stop_codon:yes gene_type:complete
VKREENKGVALVTGSAGFIGYHISSALLSEGWRVIGIDSMSDYYDVFLKADRESRLTKFKSYRSVHSKIEKDKCLLGLFENEKPDIVIHCAAQAGVRHSFENPREYLDTNITGTFELLEAAKSYPPKHMLLASTSSAYGANKNIPFKEIDKADHQVSFYAATKKSMESIAHCYSHLFNIPITVFRFFTVYGPWGRPDMALFKFTKAILNGEAIDVYNYGKMKRDFTYIDDLVNAVRLLIDCIPQAEVVGKSTLALIDSKSPVAAFRIVNVGNSNSVGLSDFISIIEKIIGMRAKKNMMPIQAGDVTDTWADTSLLKELTPYSSSTSIHTGVQKFIAWYRQYYQV